MQEQPKNTQVRSIEDMGAFRGEYPGNGNYRMQTFSSSFCLMCCVGMCFILFYQTFFWGPELMRQKPAEVPDYLPWIMRAGQCAAIFYSGFLVYAVIHNRRYPLLFALFEQGFAMVRRNGQIEKCFWNELKDVQKKEQNGFFKSSPKTFLGVSVRAKPPDPWNPDSKPRKIGIVIFYFRNAEELCEQILHAFEVRNQSSE